MQTMRSMQHQVVLGAYAALLGTASCWTFLGGVEPRHQVWRLTAPAWLLKSIAILCMVSWIHLLIYLFRGMSRRELSSGWCPLLLLGAFAIFFLYIGCFGFAPGI